MTDRSLVLSLFEGRCFKVRRLDLDLGCYSQLSVHSGWSHLVVDDLEPEEIVALTKLEELQWISSFTLGSEEVLHELDLFVLSTELESTSSQDVSFELDCIFQVFECLPNRRIDEFLRLLSLRLDFIHLLFDNVHLSPDLLGPYL